MNSNLQNPGLVRIRRDLRNKLRIRAFMLETTQVELLNQIVADYLNQNPVPR